MAKPSFVMLAHNYDEVKHGCASWFVSSKLDGCRAIYDGGVSRGMLASEIPWANVEKDHIKREVVRATGLWSRYGNVIHAPDYFLDQLPPMPLDGELYCGIGGFQKLMSTVKTIVPGPGWRDVRYMLFDLPGLGTLLNDRQINETNFKKTLTGCVQWAMARVKNPLPVFDSFEHTYNYMKLMLAATANMEVHKQERLPFNLAEARALIRERLETVTAAGGEGLMLRRPASRWSSERSYDLLKVKKLNDAEGVVIGYIAGSLTDKGSKLLGLMGSLRLRLDSGTIFDLSGFTDAERTMAFHNGGNAASYLETIPGMLVNTELAHNPSFPIGSRVTFSFRELTNAGSPKEARYMRKA